MPPSTPSRFSNSRSNSAMSAPYSGEISADTVDGEGDGNEIAVGDARTSPTSLATVDTVPAAAVVAVAFVLPSTNLNNFSCR